MKLAEIRTKAFAMPLNAPAYPRGPYKFYNREFVVINYRTAPDVLRAVARHSQPSSSVDNCPVDNTIASPYS